MRGNAPISGKRPDWKYVDRKCLRTIVRRQYDSRPGNCGALYQQLKPRFRRCTGWHFDIAIDYPENTGNSNLRISAISVSGTGFTISGNSNATLTPNQSASVYVNFVPTAAGAAVGAVTIASDASNSMVAVSVTGMGTSQGSKHAVALSWTPSASNGWVTTSIAERHRGAPTRESVRPPI